MILETNINLNNKTKGELIMFIEEAQHVIQKQQNDLEKKDKIINLMAERLEHDTEWFFSEFDDYKKQDFIEYFYKKVEG